MSNARCLESLLDAAQAHEKEYNWLKAAKLYEQALDAGGKEDFLRKGEIQEKTGYAFYRAAMQAENVDQFRKRMRQAVPAYEKAKEFYARLGGSQGTPRMLRCDAMVAYSGYWLAAEVPRKKGLIDECWKLTTKALGAFEKTGEAWEYGKTFNQLSTSVLLGFPLDWNVQSRRNTTIAAIEHGEKAIKCLSTLEKPFELARAYVQTATYLQASGFYFLDLDQRQRRYQKAASYWQKANELSEETAMIELLNSSGHATILEGDWGWGSDKAVTNFKKALEYGRKTRDKFIVGVALSWLAFNVSLKLGERILDPDEGVRLLNIALQYAEEAKHQFSPISFISSIYGALWVEAPFAEYYWDLAAWETSLTKRRTLLEKAKNAASDQLRKAEDSGYPEVIMFAHMECSVTLFSLAMMEPNSGEKRRLLEKALEHRNEAVRLNERFIPFFFWYRGFNQNYLAGIKFELASSAQNVESKKDMLQEAIRDKETSLKLCLAHITFWEGQGVVSPLLAALGAWQYGHGDLLNRLYELTNNSEHFKKAAKAFEEAAQSFQKLNLASRIAECHWKAARVYDNLGQHLKAAGSFDLASSNYRTAAENIPRLKDFYQDHALYMQAWSEIEKAKRHHVGQDYGLAREHFEKAASMHRSSKPWNYLTSNYLAWAQFENAEDLSRKEHSEEAIKAFEHAAKLFGETKNRLQTKISEIEIQDEKQLAANLIEAADRRHYYCMGRIAIEEARILDKEGDHYSSSGKYGFAAETFEGLLQAVTSEQDRMELKLIITLSHAWQKMTRAETEASPTLYIEASLLFEKAKELSATERAKMLALGHSRFCKALETGTRFADTRDAALHDTAIKHLESAANYYVKAGFQNASAYAEATKSLFDAHMYVDNAHKESDPEKKARLFMMAEKVLRASAGSFVKAEHPEKREQVERLLKKVEDERELAVSLSEVLHAPSILSTTAALATFAPDQENAVGLERFESADIQANIVTRQKELKVGENLNLEIELSNTGKGPALLTRITEITPEGFELTEKPETYRFEDNHLNLKGKRLDPLKTEELRLVLKPKARGVFPFRPKILYLDENGKYKSSEPEPVTVTVKELGIRDWIKGQW